jgi:hypothetical protein
VAHSEDLVRFSGQQVHILLSLLFTVAAVRSAASSPQRRAVTSTSSTGTDASENRFSLSMQIRLRAPGAQEDLLLMPGDTAHSGDILSLYVWADQPVYMYIIDHSGSGTPRLIFPAQGHRLVSAGQAVPFPPANRFRLNRDPAQEEILVYASQRPIAESACARLGICAALEKTESSSRDSKDNGESNKNNRERVPERRAERHKRSAPLPGSPLIDTALSKSRTITVHSDAQGTALLVFPFRHLLASPSAP